MQTLLLAHRRDCATAAASRDRACSADTAAAEEQRRQASPLGLLPPDVLLSVIGRAALPLTPWLLLEW